MYIKPDEITYVRDSEEMDTNFLEEEYVSNLFSSELIQEICICENSDVTFGLYTKYIFIIIRF